MQFTCNGQTYDTAQMTVYRIDNPAIPCIYVTPDGRQVFLPGSGEAYGQPAATQFHRASPVEIERMAAQYGITQLRRALPDGSVIRPPAH